VARGRNQLHPRELIEWDTESWIERGRVHKPGAPRPIPGDSKTWEGWVADMAPASADAEQGRLTLAGEIDIATVEAVLGTAQACLAGPAPVLEVDLGEVTFIDSSGLGALVQIRTAAADRGKTMDLTNVPAAVRRLLEVTGLHAVFPAGVDG